MTDYDCVLKATDILYYQIPRDQQLDELSVEIYCLLGVYSLTFIFAVYNVVAYLWLQRRYKNWLISGFYILSLIVLILRMVQYAYILQLYGLIQDHKDRSKEELLIHNFEDFIRTTRHIGAFFLGADYSKYALGFCQLASMAELAIVIR